MLRRFRQSLIAFLICYIVLVGFLYLTQRSLLYYPIHSWVSAKQMGLMRASDVTYQTKDGLTLRAWYQKATGGRPTLILFHGNQGKLASRVPTMQAALKQGFGMMATSYRGYSGNPGKPTEEGLYNDAEAAIAFLEKQGVKTADMILFGRSLGTGVAMEMATRYNFKAVVLLTPYTTIPDAAQHHYWYVPAKWLVKDQFDNLKKAPLIDEPVLVFHGDKDEVVPYDMGQQVYSALKSSKQLLTVEKGDHNRWDFDWVMREIDHWLRRQP